MKQPGRLGRLFQRIDKRRKTREGDKKSENVKPGKTPEGEPFLIATADKYVRQLSKGSEVIFQKVAKEGLAIDSKDRAGLESITKQAQSARDELAAGLQSAADHKADESEQRNQLAEPEKAAMLKDGQALLKQLYAQDQAETIEYAQLFSLLVNNVGSNRQWKTAEEIDFIKMNEFLSSFKQEEPKSESQLVEKTFEQRKQENIKRLTAEARKYIDAKKARLAAEKAKQEAEEKQNKGLEIKNSTETEDEKAPTEGLQPKKKGLMEAIQEKRLLRKFKKAGIEDPQKALDFYQYIRQEIDPGFDVKKSYQLDILKETCAASADPKAFYQKLKEVSSVRFVFGPNQTSSIVADSLIKDPEIIQKLDALKQVVGSLGTQPVPLYDEAVVGFCQNEGLQARGTVERLGQIKKIVAMSGENFSLSEYPALLDLVENEPVLKVVSEVVAAASNTKFKPRILTVAAEVEKLEKEGHLKKMLQAEELKLDLYSAYSSLGAVTGEEKTKNSQQLDNLELEELIKDENFQQLADDFAVIAGRNLTFKEFQQLNDVYHTHQSEILAFFQVFKEMSVVEENEKGNIAVGRFMDKFHNWHKKANYGYSFKGESDSYWVLLDPQFRAFTDKLRHAEKAKATNDDFEDLSKLAHTFTENSDLAQALNTADGQELFDFFESKGMDFRSRSHFFKYPGMVKTLKNIDRHIVIDKTWDLDRLIDLHKDPKLANGLAAFLDQSQLQDKKFEITQLPVLIRLYQNRDVLNISLVKNHFQFFSNDIVLDYLQNNPGKEADLFSLAEDGFLEGLNFWSRRNILFNNLEGILSVPREKRAKYLELFRQIENSPSHEIQRMRNELIGQMLETEEPEKVFRRIEEIFIKNNLPPAGKTYKVFAIIQPPKKMGEVLKNQENLSPCLREASERKRYFTIYQDLLDIHIKSGNRSFRDYLAIFQAGQKVFDKIENEGAERLDDAEKKQAELLLKKMKTLWENSRQGMKIEAESINLEGGIQAAYQQLKDSIGIKENMEAKGKLQKKTTVTERIERMFLAPAGYKNIQEALDAMEAAKKKADVRGREIAGQVQRGQFNVQNGDIIKSIPSNRLDSILQSGAVAREFLGSMSDSDATPYDTDVLRISKAEENSSFSANIKQYFSTNYGDLNIIVRQREGNFSETSKGKAKEYIPRKMELFKTGVISDDHYGIRTGIPSSEIDLIVMDGNDDQKDRKLKEIGFEIAKNGFYIPVVDTNGKLLFSPQQYDEYRRFFQGVETFDGGKIDFQPTETGDRNHDEVAQLMAQLPKDWEKVLEINQKIRQIILGVLAQNGIELKAEGDTSIIGAELMDTGSTARHTNAPSNYDFDLILRLDSVDMEKVPKVIDELKALFQSEKNEFYGNNNGGYQLRAMKATGIDGNPMDIDIGFVAKSELVQFGSHDAVEAKLSWLKNNIGEAAYEQTLANIILTKQVLKNGNAYKKLEQGGIGGIGVENWILANGGNMIQAFESFYAAAHDQQGKVISFDQFRKKYQILDPGINMKYNSHDNFIEILKEPGYQAMIRTIGAYLGK